MSVRSFIDTNILVYSVGPQSLKRVVAEKLLIEIEDACVSAQVISEFMSACLKKRILSLGDARLAATEFMRVLHVVAIDEPVIQKALFVLEKYKLSWWDSLIVGAALTAECESLFSEDLQHNQVFEEQLRVINPFKE